MDIYELPLFIEKEKSIECVFCHDIVWPSTILCSGGHLICAVHSEILTKCPKLLKDGQFCHKDILEVQKLHFMDELFNASLFQCRNQDRGCNEILMGKNISHHEEFECSNKPMYETNYM